MTASSSTSHEPEPIGPVNAHHCDRCRSHFAAKREERLPALERFLKGWAASNGYALKFGPMADNPTLVDLKRGES